MKSILLVLLISLSSFAMHDPKNMSREDLERAYIQAQKTIEEQQQKLQKEQEIRILTYYYLFGDPFEKTEAKAIIKRWSLANQMAYYKSDQSIYLRK